MKYIYFFALIIFFWSCSNPYSSSLIIYKDFKTIDINLKESRYQQVEEFFEYDSFISLETTEECLIGEINKIIFSDNLIFILDRLNHSIFIYNENGQFQYKINKRGEAGDEYLSLTDFYYDKEHQQLILLDGIYGKLMWYDKNGNYIKKSEIIPGRLFIPNKDNFIFYLYNSTAEFEREPIYNNLIIYDNNLKVIDQYLPFNEYWLGRRRVFGEITSILTQYNDTIFITPQLDNYIYIFDETDKNVKPAYYFNFIGDKKIHIDENSSKEEMEEYEKILSNREIATFISDLNIIDNKILFSYQYHKSRGLLYTIYDINTDKTYNCEFVFDNNGLLFKPVSYLCDIQSNYILSILKNGELEICKQVNENSSKVINEMLQSVNYEDDANPILVFYKFKNFE